MPNEIARLVIVPELVTDHRWLSSIASAFPKSHVLEGVEPVPSESLTAYAERYFERCYEGPRNRGPRAAADLEGRVGGETESLPLHEPWMMVGVGWGSCLAIEFALRAQVAGVGPQACLILGGCRSRESLPWSVRWKARLARKFPRFLLKSWAARHWLGWYPEANLLRPEMREIVKAARIQKGMSRLSWSIKAVLRWRRRRAELDASSLVLHQLHGRLDPLLPRPKMEDATILLQAGHLLHLSHPEELTRWVDAILRDDQLKREHRHPG